MMEINNQMETQRQIVISTLHEDEKQFLPLNVIISLALGLMAGIAFIIALFMGANYIVNL